MIAIPSIESYAPQIYQLSNGREVVYYPSSRTDLVKIDFVTESGTAYQSKKLVAGAAESLSSVASDKVDALGIAELQDEYGIDIQHSVGVLQCCTSFYALRRNADHLLNFAESLLREPSFPQDEIDIYRHKRRYDILCSLKTAPEMARRLFYQGLFGAEHPLGTYAEPDDTEELDRDSLVEHYRLRHRMGDVKFVVSGCVDDVILSSFEKHFGHEIPSRDLPYLQLSVDNLPHSASSYNYPMDSAVQVSLRIGRILPLRWDDPDYAGMMILTTILGGYFGSRLMKNIRETKGYTYGIYARTQVYRGVIVFYITSNVSKEHAADAEHEIFMEMQRLAEEPVPEEELEIVKNYMVGDIMRTVDGPFERSVRYIDMCAAGVTEQLSLNLQEALRECTPEKIKNLAARFFRPDEMIVCRVGAV